MEAGHRGRVRPTHPTVPGLTLCPPKICRETEEGGNRSNPSRTKHDNESFAGNGLLTTGISVELFIISLLFWEQVCALSKFTFYRTGVCCTFVVALSKTDTKAKYYHEWGEDWQCPLASNQHLPMPVALGERIVYTGVPKQSNIQVLTRLNAT